MTKPIHSAPNVQFIYADVKLSIINDCSNPERCELIHRNLSIHRKVINSSKN